MNVKISAANNADELRSQLPQIYWPNLDSAALPPGPYALMVFPGAKDEVVLSGRVRAALAAAPPGRQLVAAGYNFTTEARNALVTAQAFIVTLGDFHWTDASYLAVHAP